jgi:hypothetical protein
MVMATRFSLKPIPFLAAHGSGKWGQGVLKQRQSGGSLVPDPENAIFYSLATGRRFATAPQVMRLLIGCKPQLRSKVSTFATPMSLSEL